MEEAVEEGEARIDRRIAVIVCFMMVLTNVRPRYGDEPVRALHSSVMLEDIENEHK